MCKIRPRENLILVEKNNSLQNYIMSNRKITKSWSHKIQNEVEVIGFEYNGKPQIVYGNDDKNLMIIHSKEDHKITKKILSNFIKDFGSVAIFTRFGNFFWILQRTFTGQMQSKLIDNNQYIILGLYFYFVLCYKSRQYYESKELDSNKVN